MSQEKSVARAKIIALVWPVFTKWVHSAVAFLGKGDPVGWELLGDFGAEDVIDRLIAQLPRDITGGQIAGEFANLLRVHGSLRELRWS